MRVCVYLKAGMWNLAPIAIGVDFGISHRHCEAVGDTPNSSCLLIGRGNLFNGLEGNFEGRDVEFGISPKGGALSFNS